MLHTLDAKKLKSYFSEAFYERGRKYYLSGRVRNFSAHKKAENVGVINAIVIGSDAYRVKIELDESKNDTHIHGVCSCPIGLNCKHVVATLLKALDQGSVLNQISQTSQTSQTSHTPQTPKIARSPIFKIPRDAKVDHWLNAFKQTCATESTIEKTINETYSLFYFISPVSYRPSELEVTLTLVKRLKSGHLGAPKRFDKTSRSHHAHLYPVDVELIAKLEIAHNFSIHGNSFGSYQMDNAAVEKILPDLIRTGRCHWESYINPVLTLGPSRKAELHWTSDENGFQASEYRVNNKSVPIFFIHHAWYLCKDTWEFGLLETNVDRQIVKLLLNAPKIPPEYAQDVAEMLENSDKTARVRKPIVFKKTETEYLKPVPCLELFQVPLKEYDYYPWQMEEQKKSVARLTFEYRGKRIAWEDKAKILNHVEHDTLTRIVRHQVQEERALLQLQNSGLRFVKHSSKFKDFNREFSNYFFIDSEICDPLEFTMNTVPQLRAEGWQIEISDDYPYQAVEEQIEDWYSKIDESPGYDWFGLELGIIIQGQKINLLPVFQKLIQKLKTSDQIDIKNTGSVFAQLPDGRYIKLPTDRVRTILNVFIELYDGESLTKDDKLHLSHLHALRLAELEKAFGAAQLRWFGGEKLRTLGDKLAQFKGIENVEVPKEFKGELRQYQREGLSWLQFLREYELSGVLADDMGLGKTIQALAHIASEKASGRMTKPVLVVAPTSLMFNWRMEAERFAPHLKLLMLHGSARKTKFDQISECDLILTTYALLVRDKDILLKQHFHLCILDEAQFIKNAKNLATQIALQIKATHRLCLTGTPMENHLGELWSLFHFMMPGLLGDEKAFNRMFRTPIEKLGLQDRRDHLNKRIAPFLLRRTKDKVAKELPEKVEIIRHVELDGPQRDLYETIRLTMQKKVRQEIQTLGLARSHIIILDALLKLRQICCDPRLLKIQATQTQIETQAQTQSKNKNKSKQVKSAKLELLMELIHDLHEEGRRILLFSQFTEMLGLIEEELNASKIEYVKLTGQTQDRATPVQEFQSKKVSLFLISLKAGGTGLNLTAADTVIHYDPWWNPAVENQATDRAHRIGQDKTVFVYKLVAKDTVEEKILEMQKHKYALMEGLFSEKTTAALKLTANDLQGLFDPL